MSAARSQNEIAARRAELTSRRALVAFQTLAVYLFVFCHRLLVDSVRHRILIFLSFYVVGATSYTRKYEKQHALDILVRRHSNA